MQDWMVVAIIGIVVIFGASKLPQLAKNVGKAQTEFKKGLKEGASETDGAAETDGAPAPAAPAAQAAAPAAEATSPTPPAAQPAPTENPPTD